jgi:hypothetical protein
MKEVHPENVQPGKIYKIFFPKCLAHKGVTKTIIVLEEAIKDPRVPGWYYIVGLENNKKNYFVIQSGHNIIWELE